MSRAANGSPAVVRPATLDDLDAIMALERASFPTDAWSTGMMRDELASPHGRYVVLERDGAFAGYAGLRAVAGAADADVQTIAVTPDERGRGSGRMLLRTLVGIAHERHVRQVFLEVRDDNPVAQRLYASEGFLESGRRPRYYQPDDVDAIVMTLDVRQWAARPAPPASAPPASAASARTGSSAASARTVSPDSEMPSDAGRPAASDPNLVASPNPATGATTAATGATTAATGAMTASEPLVLGIETSCDETGIGIVRGRTLLSNTIASSMDEHARFGGVVPEVAARAHLEALQPSIEAALAEAGVALHDLDAVAVTSGPGLAGALMVGVGAAKALAVGLGTPLYAVNHLVGHIAADILDADAAPLEYPTVALLVSGGHTSLLLVRDLTTDVELLGETVDDAAGEAFDKVARILGLPYPGGPEIDRAAVDGDPTAIRFPRGLSRSSDMDRHRYDFSFSGLKTAVARYVEQTPEPVVADVAASFRESVVDVLVTKALDACARYGVPRLLLGGGVIANRRLRDVALERGAAAGVAVRIPPLSLCTDNGAMIAALASELIMSGRRPSTLSFGADSTLPVTEIQVAEATEEAAR